MENLTESTTLKHDRSMEMHEKLLLACRARNVTQQALAKRVGVRSTQMSQWVNAQGRPYWDQLRDLAQALEVSLDWLASIDDSPVPPAGVATVHLSSEERLLLHQIRTLGTEEAARRLIREELSAHPGTTTLRDALDVKMER